MKWRALLSALTLILAMSPVLTKAQVTHTVNQVGTSFSPTDLTIQVGDTVKWVWSSGFHTVTNGTGAADPSVGTLFDASLNSGFPQFEFVFTEVGAVPFFCRPHEGVGMKGTVLVEDVSTDSPPVAVSTISLHGISPNPFNPRTSISFTLGQASSVTIDVHDAKGRRVRNLASGESMESGQREVLWDGLGDSGMAVASGVYFFRVIADGSEQVARGVLVR